MSGIITAGIIGGVGSIAGGIFGSRAAKKAAREAAKRRARLQAKLDQLEANRQDIINPYEGVKDLTSMISNPMAQLSVATQAADIKIEEADIALANTLDTMRATGASAGGATALANAALRSKRGVAASIEQQEKSNEDKRAAENKEHNSRKSQNNKECNKLMLLVSSLSFNKQKIEKLHS